MAENRLPVSFHVCATCVLWGGSRSTDPFGQLASFDGDSTGVCHGGGFNQLKMNPLATCSSWSAWPAMVRR